jgi:phage-related holin
MKSKLFEARGAVFGVILDAAHILVCLAVISMTSDVTADVTRRKMVTEITKRVLVDLLISIVVTIAVVVTTTSTTSLSSLVVVVVAATTTWGIG